MMISSRVNDNDEAFDRMLAVLRFTFTKDLKFVVGSIAVSSVNPFTHHVYSVARQAM